ncbi:MAG: hypothetical protein Q9184_006470 [Pyrenodesmia sp. 2 TL-2023]
MAALRTMMLRFQATNPDTESKTSRNGPLGETAKSRLHSPTDLDCLKGEEPDYSNCWARSTVWGYGTFQEAVKAQHEVVSACLGEAMEYISSWDE